MASRTEDCDYYQIGTQDCRVELGLEALDQSFDWARELDNTSFDWDPEFDITGGSDQLQTEQTNEAGAERPDQAEESNFRAQDRAQDVAQDASPNPSRIEELPIESRLATWHSSNGSRCGGSVGSLGFASLGSQGVEKIYRFPQNEDNWIRAWIEQCDFSVTPQVLESPLNIYEDSISCDATNATYASESRSPRYHQANLDASSNDEMVPVQDPLLALSSWQSYSSGPNMWAQPAARTMKMSPPWSRRDAGVENSPLSPSNASYPPLPNIQSARGSNYSSSAASRASLAGSQASSEGSCVSLAGSHASLAGSQSSRKGKRKASDLELHGRAAPEGKRYQCTWCCKAFARLQEWNRHERSVHFELKKFVCMPNGSANYMKPCFAHPFEKCVFCGCDDPGPGHLSTQHGAAACLTKSIHERTFPRKDGLVQHIRRSHADGLLKDPNWLAIWWTRAGDVDEDDPCWECGFCGQDNMSWPERYKHVGDHFKRNADMRTWVGRDPEDGKYYCHTDFEPNRKDLPCQRTSNKRDVQFSCRNELLLHLSEHHDFFPLSKFTVEKRSWEEALSRYFKDYGGR